MKDIFAFYLKGKLKSGKKSLWVFFESLNEDRAMRDLQNKIEDAGLNPKDYFKPVRTDFHVVDDLPVEGEFCDTWCDRYSLADDGKSWERIITEPGQQLPPEAVKPASIEGTTPTPGPTLTPAANKNPRESFSKFSHAIKVVFIAEHGFDAIDTSFTKEESDKVISIAIQQEDKYYADLIKALTINEIIAMNAEHLAAFVAGVVRRYGHNDAESTFVNIRKYVDQLLAKPVEDSASSEIVTTETKSIYKRSFKQTFEYLDREISCALWPGDVDFENIPGEIDRWAQKKIKNNDEDFKRWSMALRTKSNILNYNRETIFNVIRLAPSREIYSSPVDLSIWIENYLLGHGVFECDPSNESKDMSKLFTESPLEKLTTELIEVNEIDNENHDVIETAEISNVDPVNTETIESTVSYPTFFEPGRYENIPNDVYHAANGISSTMLKDARISLMYFHGRHVIKSISRERSDALTFGSLVHTMALEPEKLAEDFNVEPIIPEGAFTGTASMRAFIDKHNANLPKMTDSDTLRSILDEHNAKLPTPYALGGNADEIGRIYTLLPPEFQSIQEGQKFTATAMKACIKEYNATLPEPLKTSGGRDALLEQLAIIDLEFATLEKAIPAPLPVSGTKEDMANRIKTILPDAIFSDEIIDAWTSSSDGRQLVTQQQMQAATAIQRALFTHPSAGPILQHQNRAVEISYFGIDEDTGLDVRVRPDLEIDLENIRLGVDLKSTSMGKIKQDFLRAKLHREIIDRDYHLSAAMYCDVAALDQFFWIFVNKDENYHWVAIVEASPDLLELGRLEYKKALRDIKQAFDTENWPAPITEEIIDDLNDFDLRRLESLRIV
ncbi:MAG: RecE family exodeoxyribonuclease [Serratia sp. (in: enterobacteria)]|uniref:RecE family exodeoxyribonuclease n=1 Tax=Serratia sp. (in: enterobacteria) TaxID=616 RepID=UPI003F2FC28E